MHGGHTAWQQQIRSCQRRPGRGSQGQSASIASSVMRPLTWPVEEASQLTQDNEAPSHPNPMHLGPLPVHAGLPHRSVRGCSFGSPSPTDLAFPDPIAPLPHLIASHLIPRSISRTHDQSPAVTPQPRGQRERGAVQRPHPPTLEPSISPTRSPLRKRNPNKPLTEAKPNQAKQPGVVAAAAGTTFSSHPAKSFHFPTAAGGTAYSHREVPMIGFAARDTRAAPTRPPPRSRPPRVSLTSPFPMRDADAAASTCDRGRSRDLALGTFWREIGRRGAWACEWCGRRVSMGSWRFGEVVCDSAAPPSAIVTLLAWVVEGWLAGFGSGIGEGRTGGRWWCLNEIHVLIQPGRAGSSLFCHETF